MKTAERAEKKREKSSARDFGRSRGRRGGGFRGGRVSDPARGGVAPAKESEPGVRTLDMDAMDEAMMESTSAAAKGLDEPGAAWHIAPTLDGTDDAPPPVISNTQEAAVEYLTKSGYLPPHLRHHKPAAAEEITNATVSDKMAARLKMMDMDD